MAKVELQHKTVSGEVRPEQPLAVSIEVMQAAKKWITRGDYVAVFTNRLIPHNGQGDIFLPLAEHDFPNYVINQTRAPDSKNGTGWRHLLAYVTKHVEDFVLDDELVHLNG